jgi:Ca2+-transporting ATPase
LVVAGQGLARVIGTGARTEIGKIGKALASVKVEGTRLQQEVSHLVRRVAIVAVSLCILVVVVYALLRGSWLNGLLAGITLAMAMLPEEFPVVLTIFLALGAWRLSQKRVLARRVATVETLGSTTVLCVDKTGTLTLNRMAVQQLEVAGQTRDVGGTDITALPEPFHEILEFGILASQRDPFDPMEKAFHQVGSHYLAGTEHLHADWNLVREYPLSPGLLALSHVWASPAGDEFVIAAKGAPEAIAELCHLDADRLAQLSARVEAMARDGLRVLGVAKSHFSHATLPGQQHDFTFDFLGLVGLADPVRPLVPEAVRECYAAGIRVIMMTGDHPGTAQSIARQIGLAAPEQVITGPELDTMDDDALQRRIADVNVFARVVPEQKLRLVTALRANGEVVAMTGDGVNDAPALKAADIGVAMGGRGTDVAREASALVLLDDDFSSIVQAVRMGRRIFDHLRKAMTYIVAIHVPIAGLSLIPMLFRWPLLLLPVHILFLELIIDPACSIVFEAEPENPDLMRRRPRDVSEPLFDRRTLTLGLIQGGSILVLVLGVFAVAWQRGYGELDARALSFTTLVLANLGLIFSNRSWSKNIIASLRTPNPPLWWVTGGTLLFLPLVLYVPVLRGLFKFSFLHWDDVLVCFVIGGASVVWFEIVKRVWASVGAAPGEVSLHRIS